MSDQVNNALTKLDKATHMLAEAKSLDEIKNILDIAEAARVYARAAKLGLEAYNHAAEIKVRAERKAGELLKQLDRNQTSGLKRGPSYQAGATESPYREVLNGNSIPNTTAQRWQQLADVPELVFEKQITQMRGEQPITTSGLIKKNNGNKNNPITYKNQPAIDDLHGHVPLAGTSHVYTVGKLLWPEAVEGLLESLLLGKSIHMCCGKSKLGTVRLDLHEPGVDIQADAAHTGLDDKSFDTVLCDPPYNGEFQWNHDLLDEMARLASRRIIFQHWFIPANPDGLYKKANNFRLTNIYVWQPRTYFGRAQLISVFDTGV